MNVTETGSKMCTKCLEFKLLDEFYADRRLRDGLGVWCKTCTRVSKRAWRRKRQERGTA